jgi:uncharacterized repeat protein (TIGR03803 family)
LSLQSGRKAAITDGGFEMVKTRTRTSLTFLRSGQSGNVLNISLGLLVVFFCAMAAVASPAQSVYFTTLVNFDGTNGANPQAPLVQGADGNFYGTTVQGGAYGGGAVFKITSAGTLTTLYSFCASGGSCPDGLWPYAGLVQASDGNLYGTTEGGGASDAGTIFKITPSGALTTLYSLCTQNGDGCYTFAGLVQASDGNFYGTTWVGGALDQGTVFKVTPGGTLTTLYSFCSQPNCTDGSDPTAALVQARDGNF